METDEAVNVPLVFSVLTNAFNSDNVVRNEADSQLRKWEEDAVPGFLASLLTIAEQTLDEVRRRTYRLVPQTCHPAIGRTPWLTSMLRQGMRMLAVVVAKNAVGSSWRKTLGTREDRVLLVGTWCRHLLHQLACTTCMYRAGEWSRIPAEEKAGVRSAALRMLFTEAAQRVAVQLALLITNTAR